MTLPTKPVNKPTHGPKMKPMKKGMATGGRNDTSVVPGS